MATKKDDDEFEAEGDEHLPLSTDAEKMGQNLKAWRNAIGLTQEKAAVMLEMSMIGLQRLERGEQILSVPLLKRLAAFYGRDWRRIEDDAPPDESTIDRSLVTSFYLLVHPLAPASPVEQARMMRLVRQANLSGLKKIPK